jgi:hypothetical protein
MNKERKTTKNESLLPIIEQLVKNQEEKSMDKIWRLDSCFECPVFFFDDRDYVCKLENKKILDLSNMDFPDWCPLEDIE